MQKTPLCRDYSLAGNTQKTYQKLIDEDQLKKKTAATCKESANQDLQGIRNVILAFDATVKTQDTPEIDLFNSVDAINDVFPFNTAKEQTETKRKTVKRNSELDAFFMDMEDISAAHGTSKTAYADKGPNACVAAMKETQLTEKIKKLQADPHFKKYERNGLPGWLVYYRTQVNPLTQGKEKDDPVLTLMKAEQDEADADLSIADKELRMKNVEMMNDVRTGPEEEDIMKGLQQVYRGSFAKSLNKHFEYVRDNLKNERGNIIQLNGAQNEGVIGSAMNVVDLCMDTASMYAYSAEKSEVRNDNDEMSKRRKKILSCADLPPQPKTKQEYSQYQCQLIEKKQRFAGTLKAGLLSATAAKTPDGIPMMFKSKPKRDEADKIIVEKENLMPHTLKEYNEGKEKIPASCKVNEMSDFANLFD